MTVREPQDVFTAREIALAAGIPERVVEALVAAGEVATLDGRFVAHHEAVRAGRLARRRAGRPDETAVSDGPGTGARLWERPGRRPERAAIFDLGDTGPRAVTGPAAVSGAVHGAALGLAVLLTAAGAATTAAPVEPGEAARLIYLSLPGPGGGGGGGGLRARLLPPRAERQGESSLSSPVVVEAPKPPAPTLPPPQPQPRPPDVQPPVVAPVATVAADTRDRAGVLDGSPSAEDGQGPGTDGGVGTGTGTGVGEGEGSGIGPGSGGGTGGGPYRPGSGIEPPRVLREVKPDYTEAARLAGVTGDVVLEIVVRRDGTVGTVRLLQGLGHGLDAEAVEAVRQWRFEPARRLGTPVDVIVEVAVEFRLR